MAEQELIKHGKKVTSLFRKNPSPFWAKVKEFIIEIIIIVFAVTISISFHDYNENRHHKKEAKEFLLGLRSDLQSDIKEMTQDKKGYQGAQTAFRFITSLPYGKTHDRDTIKKYAQQIFSTRQVVVNNARFEGFKSSGKLGYIKNDELQDHILNFYQEDLGILNISVEHHLKSQQKLLDFVFDNLRKESDTTSNLHVILSTDKARNICLPLSMAGQIIGRYDSCINKAVKIIDLIDKEDY